MNTLLLNLVFLFFPVTGNGQSYIQTEKMDQKVIHDFIESINSGNVERLYKLMTVNHEFIDSQGNKMTGNEKMKDAWIGYLNMFPDYKIEITDTFQSDSVIVLLGFASGTYKNSDGLDKNNHWRIPAAWRAIVKGDKIKLWQVYADNSIVIDIVNRNK